MKKLVVGFLTFFSINLACVATERINVDLLPYESYLILLEKPAEVVMASDVKAIDAEILTTIYNEKTQVLVKVIKESVSRLYIAVDKDLAILKINSDIDNKDEDIKLHSRVVKSIVKIDMPERQKYEEIPRDLDEPPMLEGGLE